MGWFGVKIVVEGASAEEAHALMHEYGIEHHAFHDFNGFDLVDAGEFGIMARGSHKVTIPLHGKAAKHPQEVANQIQVHNPGWKVRVK